MGVSNEIVQPLLGVVLYLEIEDANEVLFEVLDGPLEMEHFDFFIKLEQILGELFVAAKHFEEKKAFLAEGDSAVVVELEVAFEDLETHVLTEVYMEDEHIKGIEGDLVEELDSLDQLHEEEFGVTFQPSGNKELVQVSQLPMELPLFVFELAPVPVFQEGLEVLVEDRSGDLQIGVGYFAADPDFYN